MPLILLPVMIAALRGHLYAHAWSSSCQRSSRNSWLCSLWRTHEHPRRPIRGLSLSSVPPAESDEEVGGGVGPVLPKGEYHQLPRLYVGPEQAIYRIQGQQLGSEDALSPTPLSPSPPPLGANVRLQLSDDQSHYLTSVLRLLKKSKKRKTTTDPLLRVFDGQSGEWLARVVADVEDGDDDHVGASEDDAPTKKKSKRSSKHRSLVNVECLSLLRSQQPAVKDTSELVAATVWLCVAVPSSKDRFRWLLEKATELNVDIIVPIETEHSISSSGHDKKGSVVSPAKALAYLLEASEQSERLTLPRLAYVLDSDAAASTTTHDESDPSSLSTTKLVDLLDGVASTPNFSLFVCRERTGGGSVSFMQALKEALGSTLTASGPRHVAFCVGPEGGWSSSEESILDELQNKLPGVVVNVSLGPTVLRLETAAICALSAYNVCCDDLHRRSGGA